MPAARPPAWEERVADATYRMVAPPLAPHAPPDPPAALAPWEHVRIPRGSGHVAATWFPAPDPRGAVLLAPPWTKHGRAWFHRGGRIEALRAAGYAALSFDLGGFGGSTPTGGFRDLDVEAALRGLEARAPGLPLHAWGVSSGGHWLHPSLARRDAVRGAFFEDVTPHLLEWRELTTPSWRIPLRLVRRSFPRTDRFMDMRNHTPLRVRAATYVCGDRDPGVPVEAARDLASRSGARLVVIEGADHLQAMKREPARVLREAFDAFEKGENEKR